VGKKGKTTRLLVIQRCKGDRGLLRTKGGRGQMHESGRNKEIKAAPEGQTACGGEWRGMLSAVVTGCLICHDKKKKPWLGICPEVAFSSSDLESGSKKRVGSRRRGGQNPHTEMGRTPPATRSGLFITSSSSSDNGGAGRCRRRLSCGEGKKTRRHGRGAVSTGSGGSIAVLLAYGRNLKSKPLDVDAL